MEGILPSYQDFKSVILAGFDPSAALEGNPTFPMWGYGWLMLVTEDRLVLLIIQMTLALFATQVTLNHLETTTTFSPGAMRALRWFVAFAIPWYAIHAVRWPYSIAASMFLLSVVCLHRALLEPRRGIRWVLVSGSLFGLILNLRSDYYLMPLGLAAAVIWCGAQRARVAGYALVWLASIYATLVPWMIYTRHVTGHPLLTSTNGGHVFFIGLGNLPGNKWGVTAADDDPAMHSRLAKHFGEPKSSLIYESDRFLFQEFRRCVEQHPQEYLRKCGYALLSMIRFGPYPGEFYCQQSGAGERAHFEYRQHARKLVTGPLELMRERGVETAIRTTLQLFSTIIGRLVVVFGFAVLPLVFICAVRRRDVLSLLFCLAVAYQAMLQIAAYTMPAYTSNMFFVHMLNVIQGGTLLASLIYRRSPSPTSCEVTTEIKRVPINSKRRAA